MPAKADASRWETLPTDAPGRKLPAIGSDALLVHWLADAGWVRASEAGALGIGWAEISAWQESVGQPASAWQLRTLRAMSVAYAAQMNASREPDCPAPNGPALSAQQMDERLEMLFRSRAARRTEEMAT